MLRRSQVIDFPTERSLHTQGVVRGIGIAQTIAVLVTYIMLGDIPASAWIASVGFSLLGFFDDLRSLGVLPRLLIQLCIACGAIVVSTLAWPNVFTAAVIIVCGTVFLVGFVNASNFMDGINGVSLVHGALWGLVYLILLEGSGQGDWAVVSAVVLGTSAAVFPWNWGARAKAFLGDAGSYLLGGTVGLLALVVLVVTGDPLIAFGPLAIYLADTLVTLATRAIRRERLLQAHREHVFQKLAQATGHPLATTIVLTFSTSVAFIAIATQRNWMNVGVAYLLTVILIGVYLVVPKVIRGTARTP
jgi:UDP-N-acetylmuramyl pentapeptide phosphotransferase/UDP-N-acetylglucosamine-1-phosphate transferase